MKRSLPVLITVISIAVFLNACQHGESISEQLPEKRGVLKVHILDEAFWLIEAASMPDLDPSGFVQIQERAPNIQSATGTFTAYSGIAYDFAAILNPGGIHGEITIESQTRGTITAEALCVSTIEGEATAGILLNSVEFPTPFFDAGDIVYLKLKDNGEGANAAPDQTSANIIIFYNWELFPYESPEEFVTDFSCVYIEIIYAIATGTQEPFGPFQDIQEGNVQVK